MTDLEKAVREIPELLKVVKAKFTTDAPIVEAAKVKTKDGKVLSYEGDTPQAGMDIVIVAEDGTKTPAPDGDYETEAGMISVKEGKIIDVKLAEQQAAKPKANEMDEVKKLIDALTSAGFEIITSEFKKELAEYPTQMKAQKETFDNEIKGLRASFDKQAGIIKQLFDLIEKISLTPSIQSTFKKKDGAKPAATGRYEKLMADAKELSQRTF